MVRTQIQLSDDLYRRAKKFGKAREMPLAEVARRGMELLLERYPAEAESAVSWRMPVVDGGGLKVKLADLRDIAVDEQEKRGSQGPSARSR